MSEQNLTGRVERERIAHTERDVLGDNRQAVSRFGHTLWYPSRLRLNERYRQLTQDIAGKTVLDYGCGRGYSSREYLERGAIVYGIDISPVYVAEAAQAAKDAGYAEDHYTFCVMDAHTLDFPDNMFDMVVGMAILHHLDPDVALREIHRVLKPGGAVALVEPLADNPLLSLYRRLTPRLRTEDEAPFCGADVRRMTTLQSWKTDLVYAGVLEAPVAMITSLLMPERLDNVFLRTVDPLERWLHRKGWLLSWNQVVLFHMYKQAEDAETMPFIGRSAAVEGDHPCGD